MIAPETAWQLIQEQITPLPPHALLRTEAAGRVLASAIAATLDVPGTDVSAMDGFAVDASVAANQPLPIAGQVAAGDAIGFELPGGSAARIMTGATVPAGADRVIPVELARVEGDRVSFERPLEPGAHVRRRGEILVRGQEILARGARLTPGALSLLATHGVSEVLVFRPPRVALITTGDELVPPEVEPRPGQLRDSHTDFLRAAVQSLGIELKTLGIAPDEPQALTRLVEQGLGADVLLLTGGVSMGEFDLVEGVLSRLGCRALFDAVSIQPGKPLVAATHPGGLVFGLPGNPASVMICFWLFVRPALRLLMGHEDGFWHGALAAKLAAPLPAALGRDRFLPAEVEVKNGRILATPIFTRGSHDLLAMSRGTALVRAPLGQEARGVGEPCEVLVVA